MQQLLEAAQREAVGHAGDVVGDARGQVGRRAVVVPHVVRVLAEVREQAAHDEPGAIGLRAQRALPVDALEQERAQREHGLGDRLALADVARDVRGLDQVVDDRVDARRARRAEHRHGRLRQLGGVQHAGAQRVVDVVVDVRHAVDELDDAALERLRRDRPGVVEDAVAHLVRQVEAAAVALEHVDDAQRVLVVAEAALEALAQRAVQRRLAGMTEGRVAEIVAQADGLGQVLVEAQRAGDRT